MKCAVTKPDKILLQTGVERILEGLHKIDVGTRAQKFVSKEAHTTVYLFNLIIYI